MATKNSNPLSPFTSATPFSSSSFHQNQNCHLTYKNSSLILPINQFDETNRNGESNLKENHFFTERDFSKDN